MRETFTIRGVILKSIIPLSPFFVLLFFKNLQKPVLGLLIVSLILFGEMTLLLIPIHYFIVGTKRKRILFFALISPLRWGILLGLLYLLMNIIDFSPFIVIIGILFSSIVFLCSVILEMMRSH